MLRKLTAGLLFVAFCAGCGDSGPVTAPVKGRVTLDGQPLSTGRVITLPESGRGANGLIAADGTFELSTFEERDGATLGKHKIGVVAYESTGEGPESGYGRSLVPERYNNPETSDLMIEVKAGNENFAELSLTTKAGAK